MCIFRIPAPQALATPPPIKPMQDTDTSLPDSKKLIQQDDVTGIQYGTGQKKAGPAAGKKTGTSQLKIPLNTGADIGSTTGGMNV